MFDFVLGEFPGLAAGLEKLTYDQFAGWQGSRARQGTVLGPLTVPGKTHPDVVTAFSALKTPTKLFIAALTHTRVMGFRAMPIADVEQLIEIGKQQLPLEQMVIAPDFLEKVARVIHNQWLALRKSWGLVNEDSKVLNHPGDKAWEDQDETAKNNDRQLVPFWARLLADYSLSADPGCVAVITFVRQR